MSRIKSSGTKPEMALRALLPTEGARYNDPTVPGRPDVSYRGSLVAVLAHGCFWHGHSHAKVPDDAYWKRKIARNVERDAMVVATLERLGWRVFVYWECEMPWDVGPVLQALRQHISTPSLLDLKALNPHAP